jgi:hypothetical protein
VVLPLEQRMAPFTRFAADRGLPEVEAMQFGGRLASAIMRQDRAAADRIMAQGLRRVAALAARQAPDPSTIGAGRPGATDSWEHQVILSRRSSAVRPSPPTRPGVACQSRWPKIAARISPPRSSAATSRRYSGSTPT